MFSGRFESSRWSKCLRQNYIFVPMIPESRAVVVLDYAAYVNRRTVHAQYALGSMLYCILILWYAICSKLWHLSRCLRHE